MKLFYALLLTLPLLSHSYPAQSDENNNNKATSLEDVELQDNEHAASSGSESQIQKRSGSFDYVAHLKSGLLSSIGQASAGLASASSGGSSSSDSYKSYEHGNSVEYNPWSFKKSVLNTIFQAVKAITGGVTALKGQLIKGSGYALSASGNLVAASGDKVTDVGKSIINSAQINSHGYSSSGVAVVHPFAKFSSLSGASSGGSGTTTVVSKPGPVVHTETITTYEISPGHNNYGPPSKPPTYSSATHNYLPPAGGYGGGGAPFSSGHAAFEAPATNYLPSGYDGHDDFNIYGRHQKLSEAETRKAAAQLQEILSLLPSGKTEFTASKTVVLDTHNNNNLHTGTGADLNIENADLHTYGLPNDLGPLESLSHTESITAAYRQQQQRPNVPENPSDIYRQMAKKQTAEEIYLAKHPNEGYDYRPTSPTIGTNNNLNQNQNGGYKYDNYHAANSALKDLTPIIAALEVAKRHGTSTNGIGVSKHYTVEKSVYKAPPPQSQQQTASKSGGGNSNQFKYLQPTVQKTKHIYFDPAQNKVDNEYRPTYVPAPVTGVPPPHAHGSQQYAAPPYSPSYSHTHPHPAPSAASPSAASYKVRRNVPRDAVTAIKVQTKTGPYFKHQDYEINDPLMFNRMLTF